jgi:chaperonin GroEL
MQTKEIKHGIEARQKLLQGANLLADAVGVTLGAKGRLVVYEDDYGRAISTKDGVTVAKQVRHPDKEVMAGINMLREASVRTNDDAGDGPQPLYSKVLTPDGFVEMKYLKVGDKICGTNNTIQEVVGVFPKGLKEIYEVEFANRGVVECCEDHLWASTRLNRNPIARTTKNMFKDFKKVSLSGHILNRYYVPSTSVEFVKRELPIDPYTLGALLGDGSLSGTGSVELSLGFKKRHIIDKLVFPKGWDLHIQEVQRKNYIRIKIRGLNENNSRIEHVLRNLGLFGTNSHTKFIPSIYLYSSIDDRKALLQGILDTDGYINNRGLFEFSTVSDELANDFKELCMSLGYHINYRLQKRGGSGAYSENPIHKINQLVGYKNGNKIVDIRKTGRFTEMQCIKVSNPDNLYITDNYIVTHNTSTAAILSQAILREGLKNVTAGANPMDLKRGVDKAVKCVVSEIKKQAIPIEPQDSKLTDIALISANSDKEIGNNVADAVRKVGKDGVVTIEDGDGVETKVVLIEGMQFDKGLISPYFVTDGARQECVLENPLILVTEETLKSVKPLVHILEYCVKNNRPLLFICNEMEGEILTMLIMNRDKLKVGVVQAPNFGHQKTESLIDIATLTGGEMISFKKGMKLEDTTMEQLGTAGKVIISRNQTTIYEGGGDKILIQQRVADIKGQVEIAENEIAKGILRTRIGRLDGSIAVIRVGANTTNELLEKKDRYVDALSATKAALEEGIVAGGGVTLVRCLAELENLEGENPDEQTGISIIKRAITQPIKTIAENAGVNGDVVLARVVEGKKDFGYNAKTDKYENLIKSGVIDPAKVTRVALENAASVSGLMMVTECLITNVTIKD